MGTVNSSQTTPKAVPVCKRSQHSTLYVSYTVTFTAAAKRPPTELQTYKGQLLMHAAYSALSAKTMNSMTKQIGSLSSCELKYRYSGTVRQTSVSA